MAILTKGKATWIEVFGVFTVIVAVLALVYLRQIMRVFFQKDTFDFNELIQSAKGNFSYVAFINTSYRKMTYVLAARQSVYAHHYKEKKWNQQ